MEFRDKDHFKEYLMKGVDNLKLSDSTLDCFYQAILEGADPENLKYGFLRAYHDAFSYFKPILDAIDNLKRDFPEFYSDKTSITE